MPLTSASEEETSVPAVAAVYHSMEVPVAAKLATVGDAGAQNDCAAVPVGAAVVVRVAVTLNRVVLSQLPTVCVAK